MSASISLIFLGILFLGVAAYFLSKAPKPVSSSGVALLAFGLCLALGNLVMIKNIEAPRKDVEKKPEQTQAAKDTTTSPTATIAQLHQLAVAMASLQVDTIASGGRFGGGETARHKDVTKENLMTKLKGLGLSSDELAAINLSDRYWVMWDYATGILKPLNMVGEKAKYESYSKAFNGTDAPTPDQCEALLKEFDVNDDKSKELIADYRYYLQNNKQRRPAVWHDRLNW